MAALDNALIQQCLESLLATNIPYYCLLMPRPTVAQQLCHEIVEPILKASANNVKSNMSRKSIKFTNSKNEAKPTHSVCVEKKRAVSKIVPIGNTKSGINTLKAREILKKHFIDFGINTLISGPLRCDNYCVTMVRSRDQNPCKCSQKKVNGKGSNKIIQTLSSKSFSHTDKACSHHIDAVNCGIQVFDKQNILKPTLKKSKSKNNINFNIPYQDSFIIGSGKRFNKPSMHKKFTAFPNRTENANHFGGNRWALSDFPIRGPDF